MVQRRLWVLLVSLSFMITAIGLLPVAAQEGNLLRDGGFVGSYTNRGRADLNIPADWNLWVSESPRTEAWMNLPPVAFPHNGPDPNPHGGSRALNLNKGFATFTAAVYQQVAVPQGSNVTASAWAFRPSAFASVIAAGPIALRPSALASCTVTSFWKLCTDRPLSVRAWP